MFVICSNPKLIHFPFLKENPKQELYLKKWLYDFITWKHEYKIISVVGDI